MEILQHKLTEYEVTKGCSLHSVQRALLEKAVEIQGDVCAEFNGATHKVSYEDLLDCVKEPL